MLLQTYNMMMMMMKKKQQQQQQQIQKQKITPEQLFPMWVKIFDYVQELNKQDLEHSVWTSLISQKVKESNLDIGDSKFCVVGESHKFSNNYDDERCNHHALEFVSLFHNLKHHGLNTNWRESNTVKNFITHFDEVHTNW